MPSEKDLPDVNRRIALLNERESSLSDCLLITILGGTKVGKSALINALAGKVIAESSSKACFTSRPTVFVHKSRELQARSRLAGILHDNDRIEIHEAPQLERLILIDTPDFDGVEVSHLGVFQSILERSDLALCVVTTQKYDLWSLYEVLATAVGFRRIVFAFNRIDEGIPLSDKIRQDFISKISRFNLKPPEGETLPLFAISAYYALQGKLDGTPGPIGEFDSLERFLHEKLDQATVKRICEENLEAMERETRDFVFQSCRLKEAIAISDEIEKCAVSSVEQTLIQIRTNLDETSKHISQEIIHRRELSAAKSLSGPFGVYLRFYLTIETFARGLIIPSLSSFRQKASEEVAAKLEQCGTLPMNESLIQLRRALNAKAQRIGIDSQPLLSLIDPNPENLPIVDGKRSLANQISESIQDVLVEPKANIFESVLLNVIPVTIILFLVRYLVVSLISAKDPSAGMFIGGFFLLLLVCYLEAAFWLPFKTGVMKPFTNVVNDLYSANMYERWVFPLKNWSLELKKLVSLGTEIVDPQKTAKD
ncbi:50S ribosome-binding GTPase [bacterium]|nr:50S ribosome-binding GTPase [bacterium]